MTTNVSKRLEDCVMFLRQYRTIIDSHMVNFFTQNLWEKNVPTNLRKELEMVSVNDIFKKFWSTSSSDVDNNQFSTSEDSVKYTQLSKFMNDAKSLYLNNYDKCLMLEDFQCMMSDKLGYDDNSIVLDHSFMSSKKSHEVAVLSSIAASMCDALNCSHVIDIGNGKGYLSSVLFLQHKLNVLGLDSSSSNTETAFKRTKKMEKCWSGIRRRIESESGTNGETKVKKKGKNWKSKLLAEQSDQYKICDVDKIISDNVDELSKANESERKNLVELNNETGKSFLSDKEEKFNTDSNDCSGSNNSDANFKHVTCFVNTDTDIIKILQEKFPEDFININSLPSNNNNNRDGVALTGLHTCGDLAASCLNLFVKNTSNHNDQHVMRLLLNVGCCYHLLSEKYPSEYGSLKQRQKETVSVSNISLNNTNNPNIAITNDTNNVNGFPLSDYLINKKFNLSYNSRVLSSQSIERIFDANKLPDEMLFFRSLLEVVLLRKLPSYSETQLYCMGRIKCNNFTDYVNKAINKLGVNLQVTEKEISDIHDEYIVHKDRLYAYFLLRVLLAPLVEAIVLLDRLLYLHEQGISDAYLVKMFDPVVSPRCYGIVAFQK